MAVRASASPAAAPHAGSFAYADLPAAASYTGYTARVTDVGVPYLWMISYGTRWVPAWPQILGRSSTAVSGAADTAENTLGTITVPAGLMGINGGLVVQVGWNMTSSANTKTCRVRFSGAAGTIIGSAGFSTSTASAGLVYHITNVAAANSQIASPSGAISPYAGGGGSALLTASVDTSAATTVVISGEKASAGETLTLSRYVVWVLP